MKSDGKEVQESLPSTYQRYCVRESHCHGSSKWIPNLPDDIVLKVTYDGHLKFVTWEGLAVELEKIVGSTEETLAR